MWTGSILLCCNFPSMVLLNKTSVQEVDPPLHYIPAFWFFVKLTVWLFVETLNPWHGPAAHHDLKPQPARRVKYSKRCRSQHTVLPRPIETQGVASTSGTVGRNSWRLRSLWSTNILVGPETLDQDDLRNTWLNSYRKAEANEDNFPNAREHLSV